jgi:hypothetical protein
MAQPLMYGGMWALYITTPLLPEGEGGKDRSTSSILAFMVDSSAAYCHTLTRPAIYP